MEGARRPDGEDGSRQKGATAQPGPQGLPVEVSSPRQGTEAERSTEDDDIYEDF